MTFEIDDNTFETMIVYPNGEFKTMAIDGNEYPSPKPTTMPTGSTSPALPQWQ